MSSPDILIPIAAVGREPGLEARVVARAEAILDAAGRALPGWSPPPFDPVRIAGALGIPVTFAGTPRGCDAMLIPKPGSGFHIVCSDRVRSRGRLAFSVAHELAHTFFDDAGAALRMRARLHDEEDPEARELERLCDLGAAELLMPRGAFARALVETGSGADAVGGLAERFQASLEATAVRLLQLGDGDVEAVGFFEYALRPSSLADATRARTEVPEYRVRRVFQRDGVPLLFPRGKSVARSSVIYRASLGTEPLREVETFTLGRAARTFRMEAAALRLDGDDGGPPAVCAVMRREA